MWAVFFLIVLECSECVTMVIKCSTSHIQITVIVEIVSECIYEV